MSSSKTIGIIGGGQLGQMMAISAIYMGHRVIALDPVADCPASRVAEIIVAPYNDVDALRQLAERCDVLTYEFENVDADGLDADVTVFPVQENIHRNNILSKTIVPARISESLAEKAKAMAVRIAEQLNLSGTLCVEMFATADDIIVNEIAPRPHNSGHYSIEACDFSQFDTHILGVLGAPLPAIKLHAPAVMLNVLGQHVEAAEKYITENPSAHLHLYGKIEAKHNRKMGHVTLFSDVPDEVEEFLQKYEIR